MSTRKAYFTGVFVTVLIVLLIVLGYGYVNGWFSSGGELSKSEGGLLKNNATSVSSIEWNKVPDLLKKGNVTAVSQDDELNVRIVDQNGTIYTTKEPEKDAVVRAINECGLPCSGIWVFTKTDEEKEFK